MIPLTDKVLRAIRWDTIGTLLVSAVSFFTTVWLVRMLGPGSYGMLSALLSFLAATELVASGGIRYLVLRFVPQVLREEGAGAVARLMKDALWVRTAMLLVVSIALFLAPEAIAGDLLGRPDLARYMWFIPLLMAPALYGDLISAALIALFRQPTVRVSELVNKVVFASSLLFVPLWDEPIHGVFVAWIVGGVAGVLTAGAGAFRQNLLSLGDEPRSRKSRRWVHFSGSAYALSIVGFVLGRELDLLLLTRLGISDEWLAQYAVCFAFVTLMYRLPVLPIAGGFGVPLIADLYSRGRWDGLRRLYVAYFEYIYIFVLPLIGGGLILGRSMLEAIYGELYGQAAGVFFPLLILLGLTKLGGITGPFLMATDREGSSLRIRLVMSVVNVGLAIAAIPIWGAAGAAWATGVTMVGLVIWEAWVVQGYLGPRYPWGFLLRTGAATGAMMWALWGMVRFVGPAPGLRILAPMVAGGGVVYLLMLLWLRPVSAEHGKMLEGSRIPGLASLVTRLGRSGKVESSEHARA